MCDPHTVIVDEVENISGGHRIITLEGKIYNGRKLFIVVLDLIYYIEQVFNSYCR